jgi:hypothetical protein
MEGVLWWEACDALASLADEAAKYDNDGVDIYFLNNNVVGRGLRVSARSSLQETRPLNSDI